MFTHKPALIGMIHVAALPGTPREEHPLSAVIGMAADEAKIYADAGVDGVIIENMHDVPYLSGAVGPEIVASMTAVGVAVRHAFSGPLGVQILAGANHAALAVALACGADFIRAENFAYAHVADEGLMPTAAAGPLLRFRRQIEAEHIAVYADIKKKHASHSLTADVSIDETARTALFMGAAGVIVTGTATGQPVDIQELKIVREAIDAPIWIGSGVTIDNIVDYASHADALIVGSSLKLDGRWDQAVDATRVAAMVDKFRAERGG